MITLMPAQDPRQQRKPRGPRRVRVRHGPAHVCDLANLVGALRDNFSSNRLQTSAVSGDLVVRCSSPFQRFPEPMADVLQIGVQKRFFRAGGPGVILGGISSQSGHDAVSMLVSVGFAQSTGGRQGAQGRIAAMARVSSTRSRPCRSRAPDMASVAAAVARRWPRDAGHNHLAISGVLAIAGGASPNWPMIAPVSCSTSFQLQTPRVCVCCAITRFPSRVPLPFNGR